MNNQQFRTRSCTCASGNCGSRPVEIEYRTCGEITGTIFKTQTFTQSFTNWDRPNVGQIWNEGHIKAAISTTTMRNRRASLRTKVIYVIFWLEDFRGTAISTAFLNNVIAQTYANAYAEGMKVLPLYSYARGYQPSLSTEPLVTQVKAHIEQIAAIHNTWQHVIVGTRIGFIGAWGEGFSWTGRGIEGLALDSNVHQIIQHCLDHLPGYLLCRYPRWIYQIPGSSFKGMFGSAMRDDQRFSNDDIARLGLFNDSWAEGGLPNNNLGHGNGFLIPFNGVGSDSWRLQQDFIVQQSRATPFSGEPIAESDNVNRPWTVRGSGIPTHSQVHQYGFLTGTSIINGQGIAQFDNWLKLNPAARAQFYYELGYNLWLKRIAFGRGASANFAEFEVANAGNGAEVHPVDVYIKFGNLPGIKLNTDDLRKKLPLAKQTTIFRYNLPNIALGTYSVKLKLADPAYPNNPAYAFPLSNKEPNSNVDMSMDSEGYMDLKTSVTFS